MQKSEFRQSLLVKHSDDTTFEALEANNGAPRPQFVYRRLGCKRTPRRCAPGSTRDSTIPSALE
jgi:hypothetical protein